MSDITKIPGLNTLIASVSETASDLLHSLLILPKGQDTFVPEAELEKRCGKVKDGLVLDSAQIQCRARAFDVALIEKIPEKTFERLWNDMIVSALSVFDSLPSDNIIELPPTELTVGGSQLIPSAENNKASDIIYLIYHPPIEDKDTKNNVIWL